MTEVHASNQGTLIQDQIDAAPSTSKERNYSRITVKKPSLTNLEFDQHNQQESSDVVETVYERPILEEEEKESHIAASADSDLSNHVHDLEEEDEQSLLRDRVCSMDSLKFKPKVGKQFAQAQSPCKCKNRRVCKMT